MLENKDSVPMIAVKDTQVAQDFYGKKLGLKVTNIGPEDVLTCHSGKTHFLIYKSAYAGTNKANALLWPVGEELESIVKNLKSKGIEFEHYDFPETSVDGDVHISGTLKMAWFKDPDGNILHLINT